MSDASSNPPADLEMDLTLSFQPAWVKEPASAKQFAHLADHDGRSDERPGKRRDGRRNSRSQDAGRADKNRRPPRRGGRSAAPDYPRREECPTEPFLDGITVQFLPENRGVEGLARQIKAAAVAYPLFDLARLVLEKPERYRIRFACGQGATLFQLVADGTLWLSERDAVAHATTTCWQNFYRRERVTGEPPKGSHHCVAVCGLSDTLLGPPNHHDYQDKVRRLHAAQFSRMPFETYKSRIRMVRDEAVIEKWKEEQSTRDEYFALETPEGADPVKLLTPSEREEHFRRHHAAKEIVATAGRVDVSGAAVVHSSCRAVQQLIRNAWEDLDRFPLPLAHTLGQGLAAQGLQIFKAHGNITYVSVARPRALDRVAHPVSEGLGTILEYLENHPGVSRIECRKALAASDPSSDGKESASEMSVVRDLSWLLHEGYVVDYLRRGLEVVRRAPHPETDNRKLSDRPVKKAG